MKKGKRLIEVFYYLSWILGLIAAGFLIYGIIRTLGWI
jgi:hypothetical protein